MPKSMVWRSMFPDSNQLFTQLLSQDETLNEAVTQGSHEKSWWSKTYFRITIFRHLQSAAFFH